MTNKTALAPDEIHQIAFEEGQPADNGDGYLFTAEEFDLFVQRLLDSNALADHVPPAGGEPEVVAYLCNAGTVLMMADQKKEALWNGGHPLIELEGHRAHVTRLSAEVEVEKKNSINLWHRIDVLVDEKQTLQSEVERLKQVAIDRKNAQTKLCTERNDMQAELTKVKADSKRLAELDDQTIKQLGDKLRASESELTKARELFRDIADDPEMWSICSIALARRIDVFLSNQSAPADKDQGEPVAWIDPDRGLSWLADRMSIKPGTKLYAEQPAPVAVVMPDRIPAPVVGMVINGVDHYFKDNSLVTDNGSLVVSAEKLYRQP